MYVSWFFSVFLLMNFELFTLLAIKNKVVWKNKKGYILFNKCITVIRKIFIEITMSYHFTAIRMVQTIKTENTKCWQYRANENSYCWLSGCKILRSLCSIVYTLLMKLNIHLLNDQSIPFSEKWKYVPKITCIRHRIYPNCPLQENGYTKYSIFLSRILLSNKKTLFLLVTAWINLKNITWSEKKQQKQ